MHKFGTNPWKLSFKNISLDALVLKEYDIFGLLHIYIYILATEYGNHFRFWSGPQKVGSRLFYIYCILLYVLISTYVLVRGLAQC